MLDLFVPYGQRQVVGAMLLTSSVFAERGIDAERSPLGLPQHVEHGKDKFLTEAARPLLSVLKKTSAS